MRRDKHGGETPRALAWSDWISGHAGWTVLLAGGILCAVALILS